MEIEHLRALRVPARSIPVPRSVSPEAQTFLSASAIAPSRDAPDLHDVQGWIDYIASSDAYMASLNVESEKLVNSERIILGGVPTYLLRPKHHEVAAGENILLDFHGGGLIAGGGEVTRGFGAKAALGFGVTTYAPDYRLPPHHPYPAPLDDCLSAYRALLDVWRPAQIVVCGSSAGGNLAAATMLRARDEGLPLPAGLILKTPELDLTESGDSFQTLLGIDTVLKASLMPANLLYANGHDLSDPYVSPLFGDFTKGFPPTLLTAGTRDLFLSNVARMQASLRRAEIWCELILYEAMPHGGFFGAPEDDVQRKDMRLVAESFWGRHL